MLEGNKNRMVIKNQRLHQCPSCFGNGELVSFVNTGADSSEHYSRNDTCLRCYGSGKVSDEVLEQIKIGTDFRKKRIESGLSLFEAAKNEGVSVSVISKRELGIVDQL